MPLAASAHPGGPLPKLAITAPDGASAVIFLQGAQLTSWIPASGEEQLFLSRTANLAERSLRRAVLWRKRSFGTQSDAGSLFVARILTTVTTLRLQQRDFLDFPDRCLCRPPSSPPASFTSTLCSFPLNGYPQLTLALPQFRGRSPGEEKK